MRYMVNNVERNYHWQIEVDSYKKDLEAIDSLANHYDEMDSIERYNALRRILSFEFTKEDYLEIVNYIFNIYYTKIVELPTNIEWKCKSNENRYRVVLLCASGVSFDVLPNHIYKHDEIMGLINRKVILPLSEFDRKIDKCSKYREKKDDFKPLSHQGLIYHFYQDDRKYAGLDAQIKYIPSVMKYIELNVSKDKIDKCVLEFAQKLDNELAEYLKDIAIQSTMCKRSSEEFDMVRDLNCDSKYLIKNIEKEVK